jgi:hypothetical protein
LIIFNCKNKLQYLFCFIDLKVLHHFVFFCILFYAAKSRRQKLARLRQKLARFQKFARRIIDDELG